MGKRVLTMVAFGLLAVSAGAVETKDVAGGVTPEQIAQTLTGAGITITNVKITGANTAIGTFTGGKADGFDIDTGVIMSCGNISTAAGPNTSEGTTGSLGKEGDAGLDSLVAPLKTHDATILEFDAVTASPTFSIRYVFASEEYKEYVNSNFNDVFAFFVDGQNIALVPGTSEAVAVNSINHLKNSGLYRDNPSGSNAFGTSFDGFTSQLTAVAQVSAGTSHHIRLAIADTTDTILDSAVYLAEGGIAGTGVASAVIPELPELLLSNFEENDMTVTVFGVPDDATVKMSATGLPADSTVTFTSIAPLGPNTPMYKMHTKIGNDTPAGAYTLLIRAGVTAKGSDVETESFGTVLVVVDCAPPLIFGSPGHQPLNTTVTSGQTAKLTVVPSGTAAFRYQWFLGHTGSTSFPIAGATSATLTTPAITTPTEFWVRVSSPCGSVDSASALVTPR